MTGRIFVYRKVTIIRVFELYIYGKIIFYVCRNTDVFFFFRNLGFYEMRICVNIRGLIVIVKHEIAIGRGASMRFGTRSAWGLTAMVEGSIKQTVCTRSVTLDFSYVFRKHTLASIPLSLVPKQNILSLYLFIFTLTFINRNFHCDAFIGLRLCKFICLLTQLGK